MTAYLKSNGSMAAQPAPPSDAFRHLIEEAIELLLLACDEMDGDPDFEPGADGEPSLGWPERHNSPMPHEARSYGADDDREYDPAELGEPDEADFEPDVDVEPAAVPDTLNPDSEFGLERT